MEDLSKSLDQARLARFVRNPTVQPQHQWAPAFPDGTASLHSAVISHKISDVRGLLGAGADTTQIDSDGKTPLERAQLWGKTEMVYYLTSEHDELVRVLSKCLGRTPTQMEIYGVATLDKMRAFRQRVRDHTNSVGRSLMNAARDGDLVTVKTLLESGEIGVNVIDQETGESAFSAALAQDHRAVLVYLMESNTKMHGVCRIDGKRYSVLAAVVTTGDVGFVRRVVACEVSVAPAADRTTDTCALVEAVRLGSIEMIETLLTLGVGFDCSQEDLKLPKPYGNLFDRIQPSRSTTTNAEPWLLLCAACWFKDQQLFQYLIQKYPQLQDQRENPQYSAVVLVYAVFRQNEAMVSELLERGASIAAESSHSAMFAAAMNKSARMLALLLQHSSNVSATSVSVIEGSRSYNCVLSLAAYLDARDCVTLLLPLETHPYYRLQALQWALRRENFEIAALLLDAVRPISEQDLWSCIWSVDSPVMLDLLLSRRGENDSSDPSLSHVLRYHYRSSGNPDFVSVFIAHGFDITHEAGDRNNQTSQVMTDALGLWTGRPSVTMLQFALANGVPLVSTNTGGITPEQELLARDLAQADPATAQLYEDCRAVFAAFS